MFDLLSFAISTLGIAAVPLFGWLSQRWTREARLSLRVNRLGSLLSLVPTSDQQRELEGHVLAAAKELNDWIDPINRGVRAVQTAISIIMLALGLTLVVWMQSSVPLDLAWSLAVSVSVGALVAVTSIGVGTALQNLFVRRREDANRAQRLQKIRLGE